MKSKSVCLTKRYTQDLENLETQVLDKKYVVISPRSSISFKYVENKEVACRDRNPYTNTYTP